MRAAWFIAGMPWAQTVKVREYSLIRTDDDHATSAAI